MIKEKFKKRNKPVSKSDNTSILFLIAGAVSGILLFIMTKQVLLFVIAMVLSFALYCLFQPEINTMSKSKEYKKEIEQRWKFFSSFYHYSSLNNSYSEGFRLAFENLENSHLKDKISDYLENGEGVLDISFTHSQRETHILDQLIRYAKNQEEVDYRAISNHLSEIDEYKKEGCFTWIPNILSSVIFLLIWAIFFLFASFNGGK